MQVNKEDKQLREIDIFFDWNEYIRLNPHALQSLLNLCQALSSNRCMVNVQEKTKHSSFILRGITLLTTGRMLAPS